MTQTSARPETEAQASAALVSLLTGFETTQALRAAADLGLDDLLDIVRGQQDQVGVGAGLGLALTQRLLGGVALGRHLLDLDVASVEVVHGVEVVQEYLLDLVGDLRERGARVLGLGGDLGRVRGLRELALGERDGRRRDAVRRRTAVVALELRQTRRRVRRCKHLRGYSHERPFTALFTLPDETVVMLGHGPPTTIGHEKEHNPFLANDRHA